MNDAPSSDGPVFPSRHARALETWLTGLKRPLVFTNGCFDLLHRGHVSYLDTASGMGETLVVGVNSDDSVRRLGKDAGRPYNTLEDRMAILSALRSVDAVIGFEEDTPLELILVLQPDILVKGGDWSVPDIVGAEEVRLQGGRVVSVPFRFNRSTTRLVSLIRNGWTCPVGNS